MVATSPLLIPLTLSFIISSLKFSIKPSNIHENGIVFSLISPNRNISFSLKNGSLFGDSIQINRNQIDGKEFIFSVSCLNDFSLKLEAGSDSKTIPSPSLCNKNLKTGLLIGPDDGELFYGCINNVTLGGKILVQSWCRDANDDTSSSSGSGSQFEASDLLSDAAYSNGIPLQPLYIGEKVKVKENEFVALQWKNFYLFPEHRRFRISNADVIFDVIEPPEHGWLRFGNEKGHAVKSFNYEDFIRKKIFYVSNGDENLEDSFDIQIDIKNSKLDFGNPKQRTYTIKVDIEERNDAPEIMPGIRGTLIHVVPGIKTLFTEDYLKVWDSDSSTENVHLRIRNTVGGAKFTPKNNDTALTKFSLSDFLNHQIFISIDSSSTRKSASAELDAIDSQGRTSSKTIVLKITASPIEIHLMKNTGIKLLHKSSALISSQNLSFSLLTGGNENVMEIPINYVIVDQPKFGIVECSKDGSFEVCARFTQRHLENSKVRYKQTTDNRPKSDSFSFKVEAGDSESAVHDFHLDFIPLSLRVLIQESLLLNNTEVAKITRSNLLATSFPYNFPRDQLIYHIIEPPKFGMLSRKISDTKNRRIGVSSNFTQEHVDSEAISYKLHFVHYSVVNDFFVFRLVTPAVTSELLRFEITYIPGGNAIQLINRTLIVAEGHSQSITNNTLFLETADDTTFDFTVAIPPFNGNFILSNPSGSKLILRAGDSFGTFDIINRRLFYEHSGDETSSDQAYLIAESRYQSNSRIPFWFTITVINDNDHPPELMGININSSSASSEAHVIHLLEKGERTLTPSMFPWTDRDWASSASGKGALSFAFTETSFRDYVFFTKFPTQMSVRTFTTKDLEEGNLVVRDLSLKKSTMMKYTVDDGKHKVSASVKFMTDTEGFVRLDKNVIKIPYEVSNSLIPVLRTDLQGQTNMDFDMGQIQISIISMKESPIRLLENGELKDVSSFSQQDINNGNIFLYLENSNLESIKVRLRLGKLETLTSIKLIRDSSAISFKIQSSLNLGDSLVAAIDRSIIDAEGIQDPKFTIEKQPDYGSLRIETSHEKLKTIFPSNNFVRGFRASDVSAGKLQYICQRTNENDLKKGSDHFSFKIHSPKMTFGPFNIVVKKQSANELSIIPPNPLKSHIGAEISINENILKFSKSPPPDFIFKITKQPKLGTIFNRNLPKNAITSFSLNQLKYSEIVYSSSHRSGMDSFSIMVCSTGDLCSGETEVKIQIEQPNIHAPEIIKNDQLILFNSNISSLTSHHLNVQDSDSPAEALKYSIWQATGGYVALKSDAAKPISGFTQKDLEADKIVFVSNSDTPGGFSFLITDGLHQSKPEWFSVEKSTKISLTLEANSRLLAAPLQASIIGIDLLRAKISNVQPQQIIFTISRAPLHGRILMDKSKAVQKFTQADINARRISYRSDSSKLGTWSQKDSFSFLVNVEGKPSMKEEFKFKILITFGVLTSESLGQFIQTTNVAQIPLGSSFAFNSSHLNFDALEKSCGSKLIAEVYRKPTKGQLTYVRDEVSGDHASNSHEEGIPSKLFTNQFSSGRYLVYYSDTSAGNDEIIFHVYPAKEQTKRATRLRVPFFIEISEQKLEIEITKFRRELNLVSGGSTNFDPSDFQTTSENYSPSETVFTLLQPGSNGIKVVVMDSKADDQISFSQAQINKGQIRLEHTPLSNDDRFDVLVFGVDGGQTKALIIRIEPLALNLFNHSDITLEQPLTYVLLNRRHLGAHSNGDRSKIVYNITKPPENGTLYWVNGETEAREFTQKNIDDGDILYAQLDLSAYQDSFEFTLGNEEMEMLQKKSMIIVVPKIETQDLITDAKTITQVNVGFLNATALEGYTPRYLVVNPPVYGRFILHPKLNESIIFFTQADIDDGKIFFHAFDVDERVDDEVELELRGDSIQPARFKWHIDIRPVDKRLAIVEPNSRKDKEGEEVDKTMPKMAPELSQHLPVLILVIVILTTVCILCCRKSSSMKKKKAEAAQAAAARDEAALNLNLSGSDERELPSLSETTRGAELLDSTVYASVGRPRRNTLKDIAEEDPSPATIRRHPSLQQASGGGGGGINLETFSSGPQPPHCKVTPIKIPFGAAGSAFKPTPLASIGKQSRSGPLQGFKSSSISSSPTVPSKNPRGSLDAQSRLHSHSNTQLKQNQYWV